jgi:hypothetical protein
MTDVQNVLFYETHLCPLSQRGLCDPRLSLGTNAGDGAIRARSFCENGTADRSNPLIGLADFDKYPAPRRLNGE